MKEKELYIGLMTGTSLDGLDAILADFSNPSQPVTLASLSLDMPAALALELAELCTPGDSEIERLGRTDLLLAEFYTAGVKQLLAETDVEAADVCAIGCHGQTIRHRPGGDTPFTLQIGNPAWLAQHTGIDVIADFRRADMAVGGQGAPLVPAFHKAIFSDSENRVIANIGGIANITLLPANGEVIGFDTGPGNGLMNQWCQEHLGKPYDEGGAWAAGGQADEELLGRLLADPYFAEPPPKSTGREYFHLAWLRQAGGDRLAQLSAQDVQATLCLLSARTLAMAIKAQQAQCHGIYVCGGGAHNDTLMAQLQNELSSVKVTSTRALGADPDMIEALAFAWLARQAVHRQPGNLPTVTGAHRAVVLGALYAAD